MKGVSHWFLLTGVISCVIGMAWGIHMSATGDHLLSPAHGHLNLIGWVMMAIFAFYYHLVPQAAGKLAKIHYLISLATILILVPGISMAIASEADTLAKLGSVLGVISIVLFLYIVVRNGSLKSD